MSNSLLLEIDSGEFRERVDRAQTAPIDVLSKPLVASSLFYFVISRATGIETGKLVGVNKLMRIVPHHSLALFALLV